jgi:hypothetical protein
MGIREAFKDWIFDSSDSEEIVEALEGCRKHLLSRVEDSANFFEDPQGFYGASDESSEVPDWYEVLDVKTWEGVLKTNIKPTGKPKIKLQGVLENKKIGSSLIFPSEYKVIAVCRDDNQDLVHLDNWQLCQKDDVLLEIGDGEEIEVENMPLHEAPLFFRALCNGEEIKSPTFISLQSFASNSILFSGGADTITLPTLDHEESNKEGIQVFQCEIKYPKMGGFSAEIFLSQNFFLKEIIAKDTNEDQIDETKDFREAKEENRFYRFQLVTDEECQYEIYFEDDQGDKKCLIANVTADDGLPENKTSVLEVLRAKQVKSSTYLVTASSSDNDLSLIQSEKLLNESTESYYPIVGIVGLGSKQVEWHRPSQNDWKGSILGNYDETQSLVRDIRPKELKPPADVYDSWLKLREILLKASDDAHVIEAVRFFDLSGDSEFIEAKNAYLKGYESWMKNNPKDACWWETIILYGKVNETEPIGVMLSPIHPLRLGWLNDVQVMLHEASEKKAFPESKAGMPPLVGIDSTHSPGYWNLHSNDKVYEFFSVKSASNYWALLLSPELMSSGAQEKQELFSKLDYLGLKLPPVGAPLDESHITQILSEVQNFRLTRSTIRVALSSNAGNKSAANSLVSWFRNQAVESASKDSTNDWVNVLPLSFEVYSDGEESAPDSNLLATLPNFYPSTFKWYGDWASLDDQGVLLDLLVKTEILPAGPPSWKEDFPSSPVSPDFLLSRRLSIMEEHGAEKITSTCFKTNSQEPLSSLGKISLDKQQSLKAIREVYNSGSLGVKNLNVQDCFFGFPSAGADPSLILRIIPDGGVVWKLCLPSYAPTLEGGIGFFLLASINEQIKRSTARVLRSLVNNESEPDDAKVAEVLTELGQRGFDSVKHIADQEFLARGNIGLLTASRILTGNQFCSGILEMDASNEKGALVVPLDPFHSRLDQLRAHVLGPTGGKRRPDLLVIAFVNEGDCLRLKLTPVEAKCFDKRSTIANRQQFLRDQCGSFINFLKAFFVSDVENDYKGWSLARRMVLADWIEYGLNCLPENTRKIAKEFGSKLISEIITDNFAIEISKVGRLVVVDGTPESGFFRNNENTSLSKVKETLLFNKREAYNYLLNNELKDSLLTESPDDSWGLMPTSLDEDDRNVAFMGNLDEQVETTEPVTADENISPSLDQTDEPADESNQLDEIASTQNIDENQETVVHQAINNEPIEHRMDLILPKILLGQSDAPKDVFWRPFGDKGLDGEHERLLGNSHAYIAGSSGYGKSHLLEKVIGTSLISEGVVPLFFDFVGELASDEPEGFEIINAADGFDMNPLRLEPKKDNKYGRPMVQVYQLASLFKNALGLGEQQENKAKEAISNAYGDLGISIKAKLDSEPSSWPTFEELWQYIQNDSDERFVARMKPVFEWDVFNGTAGSFSSLLAKPTIVDFKELCEAGESLANVVSQILVRGIFNHLVSGKSSVGVKYVLIIDEAHRVCKLPAIEKMLREVRKFGCGVWLASQSPDDFSEQLRSLITSKFIFRLETDSDAKLAEKELSASNGSLKQDIRDLGVGECFYRDAQHTPFERLKIRPS